MYVSQMTIFRQEKCSSEKNEDQLIVQVSKHNYYKGKSTAYQIFQFLCQHSSHSTIQFLFLFMLVKSTVLSSVY
jgi:hypothetical protein